MSSDLDEEASISIPSIAFVTIVGFLIYRYFFSSASSTSSSSSSNSSSASSASRNARYTTQQVDSIAQMFPQLNRRDIMWDLQRNRGNVQMTTERILRVGRLDAAPQSFQPPTLSPTTPASGTSILQSIGQSSTAKRIIEPDLITRYNLQSRVGASDKGKEREVVVGEKNDDETVNEDGSATAAVAGQPNYGWASTKDERQAMLKRRRDEMILAARRKMQERVARGETVGE